MTADRRYEIKFILDEGKLGELLSWIYSSTGFSPAFEPRYVNSLYFDDLSYQSARDNLAGVSDRRKMRIRWYHFSDVDDFSLPALEFKYRTGRLGHKTSVSLSGFRDTLFDTKMDEFYPQLCKELAGLGTAQNLALDDFYMPTLRVQYLREYFQDPRGLRLTIDKRIQFFQAHSSSNLRDGIGAQYPLTVAEIKFSPHQKQAVVEMLRTLHLMPKRHSKYLVGLSIFEQALYV